MIRTTKPHLVAYNGFCNKCSIIDPLLKRPIRDFVEGCFDLNLWENMVSVPLRSAQQSATTTIHTLGGAATTTGTLQNGVEADDDGFIFATAEGTGRNRRIDIAWNGFDLRANTTAFIVSNAGDINPAGTFDTYLLGSNGSNGGFGVAGFRELSGNDSDNTTINAVVNIGNVNYVSLAGQSVPAQWRSWTAQRENNTDGNTNVQGNRFFQNTTQIANGSNNAQTPYGAIPNATTTLVIGNGRTNTTMAPVGKISMVWLVNDWTVSVSALHDLYKTTLGIGLNLP